ncbi:hypothetical protein ACSNOE_29550, partial [Streptomyces radiopugnans]
MIGRRIGVMIGVSGLVVRVRTTSVVVSVGMTGVTIAVVSVGTTGIRGVVTDVRTVGGSAGTTGVS